MKKIAILLYIIIASLNIAAEDHYTANISVGLKAGGILSQTMFSPSVKQSFATGMAAGAMFRYIEEPHFGLIAELNYQERGWKETFGETSYSFSRKLSYIQIPLLAHIYFGNRHAKFFFNAGPEIGFMIADKSKANFDINNLASLTDLPIENRNTEQFTMGIKNKIDYGISAGLGMEMRLNKKNSILLEGRFYYGLNNIFGSNKKDVFSASNGISIMATIGYMFRLK